MDLEDSVNNNRCVVCGKVMPKDSQVCVICGHSTEPKKDEALQQLQEDNKVLKQLINGEWVDCDAVQRALGIDFGTGLKRFEFGRTAEWNPAPLNGQKITTKFRLQLSKVSEKQLPKKPIVPWNNIKGIFGCTECDHFVEQGDRYCSTCGQALDWSDFE